MITIYIYIFIFILCVIITYNHMFYKSKNLYRHKDLDTLGGHFSKIDTYNYFIFPKLLLARPIYFTLKPGDSIYMPKHWWHWVKTVKKSFAINVWFNNTSQNNVNKPYIFTQKLVADNFNINILDNELVSIEDSSIQNIHYLPVPIKFNKFYNTIKNNKYIITIEDYDSGKINNKIKDIMKEYIKFPYNTQIDTDKFGYNIWASSGYCDTGLHYDDEDGILSVIEGEKNIIMFPPSDSKYLYPYKVSYKWLSNIALNFRYNSYDNIGIINGISSSQLLYETCKHDKRVLSNISKLYNNYNNNNNNNLIWGFKKNKDIYRWEIYKYDFNKNPLITSNDIMQGEYNIGDEEHYYYNMNKKLGLPFWGYSKYKKNNTMYLECKIGVTDTYSSFVDNYDSYMKKLEYSSIKDKFKNIILNKYKCYELSIANKTRDQIFVKYLGILNEDFLNFLIQCNYPINIINFIQKNIALKNYNINNEITIVYDINNMEIIRSGFYGNI